MRWHGTQAQGFADLAHDAWHVKGSEVPKGGAHCLEGGWYQATLQAEPWLV